MKKARKLELRMLKMTMVSYTQIKWKPHEFIRNNLSGVQFGRKKIQREVSRLSKWNKGFFQLIKTCLNAFKRQTLPSPPSSTAAISFRLNCLLLNLVTLHADFINHK